MKVYFAKKNNVHIVQQTRNDSQDHALVVDEDTDVQTNIRCPICIIHVEGIGVNILVDSGSPYANIPEALYDNLFSHCELHESNIAHGGYDGSPINILGYFNATPQHKGRTTEERVYVSRKGATIISWPTQAKLQIVHKCSLFYRLHRL